MVKYIKVFFPICWNHERDKDYSEDIIDNFCTDEEFKGNLLPESKMINQFLDMFIPIYKSYTLGIMNEEEYKLIVNGIIKTLD